MSLRRHPFFRGCEEELRCAVKQQFNREITQISEETRCEAQCRLTEELDRIIAFGYAPYYYLLYRILNLDIQNYDY